MLTRVRRAAVALHSTTATATTPIQISRTRGQEWSGYASTSILGAVATTSTSTIIAKRRVSTTITTAANIAKDDEEQYEFGVGVGGDVIHGNGDRGGPNERILAALSQGKPNSFLPSSINPHSTHPRCSPTTRAHATRPGPIQTAFSQPRYKRD